MLESKSIFLFLAFQFFIISDSHELKSAAPLTNSEVLFLKRCWTFLPRTLMKLYSSNGVIENIISEVNQYVSNKTSQRLLNDNGWQLSVCGEQVFWDSERGGVQEMKEFSRFLIFEREKYIRTELIHNPKISLIKEDNEYFEFSIDYEVTSLMSVTFKKKITIRARRFYFRHEITPSYQWYVTHINFDGECHKTTKYIKSTWESTKNQTTLFRLFDGRAFDENSKYLSNNFEMLAQIGNLTRFSKANAHIFFNYILQRYSVESIQTEFLAENVDQVVFNTFTKFTNRVYRKKTKWSFQMEAIYNIDDDEKWKITRIFVNHPSDQFIYSELEWNFEYFVEHTVTIKKTIENIGRNKLEELEKLRNHLRYLKSFTETRFHKGLSMNIQEKVLEIFKPENNLKLYKCENYYPEKKLIQEKYTFQIKCWWKDQWGIAKITRVNMTSVIKNLSNHIVSVELVPSDFVRNNIQDFFVNDENDEKTGVAEVISELLLSQDELNSSSWRNNTNKLKKMMGSSEFQFYVCSFEVPDIFRFLEKRRRKVRVTENKYYVFNITNSSNSNYFEFTLRNFPTSFMSFEYMETYRIQVQKNNSWEIMRIDLMDHCISDRINRPAEVGLLAIDTANSRDNLDASHPLHTLIYTLHLDNFNESDYFSKFEAIIETNDNASEIYDLTDFIKYLKVFSNIYEFTLYMNHYIVFENDYIVIRHWVAYNLVLRDRRKTDRKDEFVFLIEAFYNNDIHRWQFVKIVLTRPADELYNASEQFELVERSRERYMGWIDERYNKAFKSVEIDDIADYDGSLACNTNYDSLNVQFFQKYLSYVKNVVNQLFLRNRTRSELEKQYIRSFDFQFSDVYIIDDGEKGFTVDYYVKYNQKFNSYQVTNINLSCVVDWRLENFAHRFPLFFPPYDRLKSAYGKITFYYTDSYCGTNSVEKFASYLPTPRGFEQSASHCCALHDDCYDHHLGQTYCDDSFSSCLAGKTHLLADQAFYMLVKHFGDEAYKNADSQIGHIYEFRDEKLNSEFNIVRFHCPQHKNVFSSCIIQFEICTNRQIFDCPKKTDYCYDRYYEICKEKLANCLRKLRDKYRKKFEEQNRWGNYSKCSNIIKSFNKNILGFEESQIRLTFND
ncbi:unnamed protein product [Caenorhabditis angaria]|uniref:Uncharacterized protein n=1 Tax=Caenorhabditis angaria TaxID=860376 RepID=A0A9P1N6R7_9PELO|nr:unnamed protein product [Caenorhabditis angaria]